MDVTKTAGYIVILLAIAGAAFIVLNTPRVPAGAATALVAAAPASNAGAAAGSEVAIEITDAGFKPGRVTVALGGRVTWTNKGSRPAWPASDLHPVHTLYTGAAYDQPGSFRGSRACAGEGQPKPGAFDSCKPLAPGDRWTFQFNQKGSWDYHDHLNAARGATVVVQ